VNPPFLLQSSIPTNATYGRVFLRYAPGRFPVLIPTPPPRVSRQDAATTLRCSRIPALRGLCLAVQVPSALRLRRNYLRCAPGRFLFIPTHHPPRTPALLRNASRVPRLQHSQASTPSRQSPRQDSEAESWHVDCFVPVLSFPHPRSKPLFSGIRAAEPWPHGCQAATFRPRAGRFAIRGKTALNHRPGFGRPTSLFQSLLDRCYMPGRPPSLTPTALSFGHELQERKGKPPPSRPQKKSANHRRPSKVFLTFPKRKSCAATAAPGSLRLIANTLELPVIRVVGVAVKVREGGRNFSCLYEKPPVRLDRRLFEEPAPHPSCRTDAPL